MRIEKPIDADFLNQKRIMDRLQVGFWEFDVPNGRFRATDTWLHIRGLEPGTPIDVSDRKWTSLIHKEDRQRVLDVFKAQKSGEMQVVNVQYRHGHPIKGWVWILCRASVLETDTAGRATRIIGVDTEITELKTKEAEKIELAETLQLAVEVSGMGIWEFDEASMTVHWDDRMLEIYGIDDGSNYRSADCWASRLHPEDHDELVGYAEECQHLNRDFMRDYRIVRKGGEVRHVRSLARSIRAATGGQRLIGVNIDITEDMRRTQELEDARIQLRHEALHDSLTGLGNRRNLDAMMEEFLGNCGPTDAFVVGAIDLDGFKALNDSLGHAAGDAALVRASAAIRTCLGDDGTAYRVGGDEFAFVITSGMPDDEIGRLCQRIVVALSEPFEFDGAICRIGGSIGFAKGYGQPETVSQVFRQADAALYAAKRAGRGCFRAFGMHETVSTPYGASQDDPIVRALEEGRLSCEFQPQFCARTNTLIGAEALVCLNLPGRTRITKDDLLAHSKRSHGLDRLDRAVFRMVLDHQDRWQQTGLPVLPVGVNMSLERLTDAHLEADIATLMRPHHAISFELLETAMYDDPPKNVRLRLKAIRNAGIRIELDDFGSGHASVLALRALRPDRIKFDGTMVASLARDPEMIGALDALIRVARLHGAEILLEGVEDQGLLDAVRDLDCDALQGHALARPMPPEAFEALLQRHRKPWTAHPFP